MELQALIEQLNHLQIDQSKIIKQIADLTRAPTKTKEENQELQVGDHVTLLTKGVKCKKGDKARVTIVTETLVHFIVLRNGHSTFRKRTNVKKVILP